jgi:hypothetical protein
MIQQHLNKLPQIDKEKLKVAFEQMTPTIVPVEEDLFIGVHVSESSGFEVVSSEGFWTLLRKVGC